MEAKVLHSGLENALCTVFSVEIFLSAKKTVFELKYCQKMYFVFCVSTIIHFLSDFISKQKTKNAPLCMYFNGNLKR